MSDTSDTSQPAAPGPDDPGYWLPVDSTIDAEQRHRREKTHPAATDHTCRFSWCSNGRETIGVDLEHMSDVYTVTATAGINQVGMDVQHVDASLWYQEDLEYAPDIHLSIDGRGADLRIEEAVLLANNLNLLINAAIAGKKMNLHGIVENYARPPQSVTGR